MSEGEPGFGRRPDDPYPGRRQSDDLTAAELRAQPAWWFPPPDGHLTGPDACTVMPVDTSAAVDGVCEFPAGRWLLHATFVLADGTALDGHVTWIAGETPEAARAPGPQPSASSRLAKVPPRAIAESQEPAICTPHGQVALWHGVVVPDAATVVRMLAALGKPREAVFPVRWRTSLRPSSHEIGGSADGFLVWRGGRVGAV